MNINVTMHVYLHDDEAPADLMKLGGELLAELVKNRRLLILTRKDIMDQMDQLKAALAAGQEVAAQNLALGQQAINLLGTQAQNIADLVTQLQDSVTTGASSAEMQEVLDQYGAQVAAQQDEIARLQVALDALKPPAEVPPA